MDVARWRRAERERQLALRRALGRAGRERLAARIAEHLEKVLGEVSGLDVAAYLPIRGEPDLRLLIERLVRRGARCALPVVVARGAPLVFRAWSPGERLERGAWNIPVPAQGMEVTPDVVISPVVAYDCLCYRLGNGGGYYDRTLAAMPARPRVIGVGYAQAGVPTIYPLRHDVPMDAVVTEDGVTLPRRGRAASGSASDDAGADPSRRHAGAHEAGSFRYAHADGYAEAIPIDELVAIARAVADECGQRAESDVHECAQRIVRSRLCPCAASVDALVDAVVTEFRRHCT